MSRRYSTFHIPHRRAPETEALAGALSRLQDNYRQEPYNPVHWLTCGRAHIRVKEQEKDTLLYITYRPRH